MSLQTLPEPSLPDVLLETRGIGKQFQGFKALNGVDFDVQSGEIHALMGENGAGKSTLIKVLTGVYPPEEGEVLFSGKLVRMGSTIEAVKTGISTVYQEVNLAPNLSVAENICIGREPRGPFGIRWRAIYARAEKALERVGLKIDVRRPVRTCPLAVQQMVAIARALDVSAKVLILDEPTSSLDRPEVEQLFALMRRLRSEGLGIVFVTHFLDQVYEVSDRITVLRNGVRVGTWEAASLPRIELVSQMLGRDASTLEHAGGVRREPSSGEAPVVTAKGLGRRGSVEGVDLDLRPGQTLGLAGLLGSGRTETVRLLFGIDTPDQGDVSVGGSVVRRYTPRSFIRRGVGLCGEDRKREGILPELTVRENLVLALQAQKGWLRKISLAEEVRLGREYVGRLNVRPPDLERQIQFLSGGNQQKVLLARWLAANPKVLLLDEPTRGIDVGAKFEIMELVERLRQEGMAFVFVSSELAEVVRVSTEVLVYRDRRVVGLLRGDEITEPRVVQAIAESVA
ncbi:MAG TPA: sugar ABC transporter ATP-binding protein [Fimbriimonas sp.]|nr:sugar ABC transporter ATP-binding protein [Fimbriimonas sp.]